jgi:hypothetical protein
MVVTLPLLHYWVVAQYCFVIHVTIASKKEVYAQMVYEVIQKTSECHSAESNDNL